MLMVFRQASALAGLLVAFCTIASVKALEQDRVSAGPASIPVVDLEISSRTEVPGTGAPFLMNSICSADNTGFITQMYAPNGDGDVEFISNDGKKVVRLALDTMTDISKPLVDSFTVNESSIDILVVGHTPQNKTLTLRTPNGHTITQPAYTIHYHVARFRKDGSYAGSVPLDLPFIPRQIGAFPQGDFFFAGEESGTSEPRAALVKSTGQLDRFLELPGDIHGQSGSEQPGNDPLALPRFGKNYTDTLWSVVGTSIVVPDGRNLLLIRPGQKTPVYSISPGGAVQPVAIEVPEGFKLFDLKAARDHWIADYNRPSQNPQAGLETVTYALDKTTGKLLTQFVIPQNLALGLACSDGQTFTVLSWDDDKLTSSASLKCINLHRTHIHRFTAIPCTSNRASNSSDESPRPGSSRGSRYDTHR